MAEALLLFNHAGGLFRRKRIDEHARRTVRWQNERPACQKERV